MTSKIPDSNCAANPALILCAVSFTKLISVSAIKMTTRVSDSSSGWILLNTLLRVLCKKERNKLFNYVYFVIFWGVTQLPARANKKLIYVSSINMTSKMSNSSLGWILLNKLLRVLCKKREKQII